MSSARDAIFRNIVRDVHRDFVYVTDHRAYGRTDVWRPLREVAGKLAGDCEDFCITVAERCVDSGIPREAMVLHVVEIPDVGHHVVIECDGLIADCNEADVLPVNHAFYFRWVSHRRLTEPDWKHT